MIKTENAFHNINEDLKGPLKEVKGVCTGTDI